ncbi:ATP-grasp domain-containing protein [Halomonas sp. BC04]|uniref:ATP-grasp domain-containing protein n=1 Tax=Halomonas sp. BC04 TaxID=1403540 RepID=UPI0004BBE65A|nr:ATP-grasp domain-containing protein [Halomonas sp. BC04]
MVINLGAWGQHMNDCVFILGGSPLQKSLLDVVNSRYTSVVVDGDSHCALASKCGSFINIDFSNVSLLESYAKDYRPKLIVTAASEVGNLAAAQVCNNMGIPYNSFKTVHDAINKYAMKERLTRCGVNTPELLGIYQDKKLNISKALRYPIIVKPSQSSAGRGVRMIYSELELHKSLSDASMLSKDGAALIEEYVEGAQYSVETISSNGKHVIVGVAREYFGSKPFFAETHVIFPAQLSLNKRDEVYCAVYKTLDSFGVFVGACHVEIRVAEDGQVYIIELATRMGGWRHELIAHAFGADYSNMMLKAYEGLDVSSENEKNSYAVLKHLYSDSDIDLYDKLIKDKRFFVSDVTWLKDSIQDKQSSLMDSAGYFFIESSRYEDICHVA